MLDGICPALGSIESDWAHNGLIDLGLQVNRYLAVAEDSSELLPLQPSRIATGVGEGVAICTGYTVEPKYLN